MLRSGLVVVLIVAVVGIATVQGMPISDELKRSLTDLMVGGDAANCQYNGTDFSSLSGQDYPVSDTNYKYIVHVCNVATQTDCAQRSGSMCEYNMQTGVFMHVLGRFDSTGKWAQCTDFNSCPDGGVSVTFANGDNCGAQPRQTTVNFACSMNSNDPITVFSPFTCAYTFTIPTPIACSANPDPPAEYCVVYLQGGAIKYDLSGLAAPVGLPHANPDYSYRFNPCGVVHDGGGCEGAHGAVCQYRFQPNVFNHVLAAQPGPTSAGTWSLLDPNDPNKGVSAYFANGDLCANTKNKRQVTMNFVCNSLGNSTAYLITESPMCVYTIEMETPYACPV